ncbi:M48 family metallopeptidase [Frigidibacter sp. MR17.24]|uniref:M48 family metallopeptidase n=1 Tax=Frigidibacter sp. MR17.24 TaxID=3127345 RepID=UPI003012BD49
MAERALAPGIEITLRRSARARRFSLRVSQIDGRISLTLPTRAREAEALQFARAHEGWIRAALTRMGFDPAAPATAPLSFGDEVPFEGRPLRLTPAAIRSPRIEGGALLLPADPGRMPARLGAFLKLAARDRLTAASDRYSAAVGRRYARITLRDTRSRWGSCAQDGALMYSWRLIMAPPAVLDYVAAHECAHLVEMNHSPDFWAVVARLDPGYAAHRRWLRTEGNALHRLRLSAAD